MGIEGVIGMTGGATSSNYLISPKQFEEFVLPTLKKGQEALRSLGYKTTYVHICGEHNANLPFGSQVPMGNPGIVSIGKEVDISTAINFFGENCIIAGNINPATLQTGTPREVYELCKQALDKGRHAPRGYALMQGCEVPVQTPPHNLYIMKKAIYDWGWYDNV